MAVNEAVASGNVHQLESIKDVSLSQLPNCARHAAPVATSLVHGGAWLERSLYTIGNKLVAFSGLDVCHACNLFPCSS